MEITADELRARARGKLFRRDGVPGYGTYLVGLLLMSAAATLGAIVAYGAYCAFLAFADIWGSASPDAEGAIVVCAAIASIPLAIGIFYLFGFMNWSQRTMALSAMRDDLQTSQGVSGWGHGWRMVALMLWQHTFIFLWALLLIVPGVRAAFSYAMAPYLQIDHPDWTPRRCIAESKRLMEGHRLRYFRLCLSFVGWAILAVLVDQVTFACGRWLLTPYFDTASAAFYEDLLARGTADASPAPAERPSDLGWPTVPCFVL